MRKPILRKLLLLVPIVVLSLTLLFVNFAVRSFNDTAYSFMYDTNVQTVQSFSDELRMLSSQGFTSTEHSSLYTNMIHNFSKAIGVKDAIVTFIVDESGQIHHSSGYNEAYITKLLQSDANKSLVSSAATSPAESGEITMDHGDRTEQMYYHTFYSDQDYYRLFISIDRNDINAQLNADSVIIPLCAVGLLLLFALEYIIWLKLLCVRCGSCKLGNDSRGSHPAASKPAASEPGGSEPIGD